MLVRRLVVLLCVLCSVSAWGADVIRVGTQNVDLIFRVGNNKRLEQVYLGRKLLNNQDLQYLTEGQEAYLTHGMEDYFEPAIQVEHNDHNSSLELKYVSHEKKVLQNGVDEIIVYTGSKALKPTVLVDQKYHIDMQDLTKVDAFEWKTNSNMILVETLTSGHVETYNAGAVITVA